MSLGKAFFITFEGLDGSGKSTHLERVATCLAGSGRLSVQTREPGGTPLGDNLRGLHLSPGRAPADGMVEALLMFASRRQLLAEVIDPALEAGKVVLCDRFSDSSFAYQGFGREVGLEAVLAIDRLATGGRRADRTLLFDLPAEAARERGQSSERRVAGEADRLDLETVAFYERVREGFLAMAAREPDRFRIIDSRGSLEDTWKQVRRALGDLLEELR